MTAGVAIIDYGMGNLASVAKAFAALGAGSSFATTPDAVESAAVLVLPGVGAFPDAMANLRRTGLDRAIVAAARAGKPLLGICLGMQLLFSRGTEKGECEGLGLIDGTVVRFPDEPRLKVPHMGWNQVEPRGEHPLFRDVPKGSWVYFVHSYFPKAADADTLATTEYGVHFPCIVGRGRTVGIQFHPEKSQNVGLKLLSNFLEMCK